MISALLPYLTSIFDWADWLLRKALIWSDERQPFERRIDLALPPRPYRILLSVHNLENRLQEFDAMMGRYKPHVLMVDDASVDNTAAKAKAMGYEVLPCAVNKHKPQEIRHALPHLDPSIETVIVMDPDTIVLERHAGTSQTLDEAVSWFQQTGADAASVNMRVKNENFVTTLQDLEYSISMQVGRQSIAPDGVVSGGFAFFKRTSLDLVMREHSGNVNGEDYETSVRILRKNGRILHNNNFTVQTEGPDTFRKLTRQRIWWDQCLLRIVLDAFSIPQDPKLNPRKEKRLRAFYNHFVYNLGVDILAYPLKLGSLMFLAMSLANVLDNLAGVRLLPDVISTPLGPTDVGPWTAVIFCTSYILLAGVNIFTNQIPDKRKFVGPALIYPLYRAYQLSLPRVLGFSKAVASRFRRVPQAAVLMLPKNDYDNGDFTGPSIPREFVYEGFKHGWREVRLVFYKTNFHDVFIVDVAGKAFDGWLKGETVVLGLDLDDRKYLLVPFADAERFFRRRDSLALVGIPYKLQLAHVQEAEGGVSILYRDVIGTRRMPWYLAHSRGEIVSNRAVGEAPPIGPSLSRCSSLHVAMIRGREGVIWEIRKGPEGEDLNPAGGSLGT